MSFPCCSSRVRRPHRSAFLVLLLNVLLPVAPAAAQEGSPSGAVPVSALIRRRAALAHQLGGGVAVVTSAEERGGAAYAQDSEYRENNDFLYLSGLEAPGGVLLLTRNADGSAEVVLYLPKRNPGGERVTGPRLGPGPEASTLTGISQVRSREQLLPDLVRLRQLRGDTLWTVLEPSSGRNCSGLPVLAGRCAPALADIGVEPGAVRDLRPLLARLRSVKDADELGRLRTAAAITDAAHRAAAGAVGPGAWEYEVEALIEYTFHRAGAERVGFPSIVGSGPFSTVLHYDRNRRQMQAGELVVIDIGAEYGYYTADITRTYPVSGRFSPRQRAIYQLVLGAQQAAVEAVRPGAGFAELTRIAQEYMRSHSGPLCGERTCDQYFIHGISHHIGMDVHDVGPGAPLEPGMVITIEPGIYLPDEQLGVRIEDDVLVTVGGHEELTAAPRTVAEIERAMAEAKAGRARALRR